MLINAGTSSLLSRITTCFSQPKRHPRTPNMIEYKQIVIPTVIMPQLTLLLSFLLFSFLLLHGVCLTGIGGSSITP